MGGEYSSARKQNREGMRSCSALGGVKGSYGPVSIKTDLNQSYCSYLEMSAIAASMSLNFQISQCKLCSRFLVG